MEEKPFEKVLKVFLVSVDGPEFIPTLYLFCSIKVQKICKLLSRGKER